MLRLNYDPKDIPNPKDRYAPIKWLLNDEHVRYMRQESSSSAARAYRRQRREKYAQLLDHLEAELLKANGDRLADIERSGRWEDYSVTVGESVRSQVCVGILRMALFLHLLHLPGPQGFARAACQLIRYAALSGSRVARVVPIR